jgi:ferredoxin
LTKHIGIVASLGSLQFPISFCPKKAGDQAALPENLIKGGVMQKPRIVVDHAKCKGSGKCVAICPQKAFSIVGGKAVLDEEKCDLDGICIPVCPTGAIRYVEAESPE